MNDLIGRTLLNRYKIQALIGRGGMAEVYKAWDQQRAVCLALKLLREDFSEDGVFLRRFTREARTLAHLQHPHIVRFYGLEQDGPLAFILMDFIEGSSLRREIFDARGPLSNRRVLEVLRPACAALHYAHSQGFVHCDVKPGNILIDNNNNVFVTDFGIARMSESATVTLVGVGTPAYMAPEQVEGREPTPLVDIYSLGVVLYELLTGGERPFTGERAQITGTIGEKVRWEQQHLDPPAPTTYNPLISSTLETVTLRCLEKHPEKRFGSMLELIAALENALSLAPPAKLPADFEEPRAEILPPVVDKSVENMNSVVIPAAQPAIPPLDSDKRKARSTLKVLAGLGIFIVLSVIVFSMLGLGGFNSSRNGMPAAIITDSNMVTSAPVIHQTSIPIPATSTSPTVTTASSSKASSPALPTRLPISPTPTMLIAPSSTSIATSPPTPSFVRITADNALQVKEISAILVARSGDIRSLDWSPDGQKVVTGDGQGWIRVTDISKGSQLFQFKGHQGAANGVVWSPDGSRIASVGSDGAIQVWDASQGQKLSEFDQAHGGEEVTSVDWSPDGRLLATGGGDNRVRVWSPSEQNMLKELNFAFGDVLSVAWSPGGDFLAAAGKAHHLKVWAVVGWAEQAALELKPDPRNDIDWSPDGTRLASGGSGLHIYYLNTKRLTRIQDIGLWCRSVSWSPAEDLLAVGGNSPYPQVNLVKSDTGVILSSFATDSEILALGWSPDGTRLASGESGFIKIYGIPE